MRRRVFILLLALSLAPRTAAAAERRVTLLLLPIAASAGSEEWVGRALGAALEEDLAAVKAVQPVRGAAREQALRELAKLTAVTSAELAAVAGPAGAEFAVFGGCTLLDGRLGLSLRLFDVAAGEERRAFNGEEDVARAFALVAAGASHLVAAVGGSLSREEHSLMERIPTASIQAYGAYHSALREQDDGRRVAELRRALEIDPDYLDAALRLGTELFRQGSAAEALLVLERVLGRVTGTAEARNNYGVILATAGRPEQAQKEFERALGLAPAYAEARLNLARVLEERGLLPAAEKQYLHLLKADAENAKARAGLAVLYDRMNRPELAVKEFRALSAKHPELAELEYLKAGREARKARDFEKAEKYFRRAVDINPEAVDAWGELGTNSYLAGEHEKSAEHFRTALARDPQRAEFHYDLGLALEKGKRPTDAVASFVRAVELGGPPEARLGLARLALDAGEPGKAVEELNLLLAVRPGDAEAKRLLAEATGEMEARRRLVEEQSRFASRRLERLEQIVDDLNRSRRELEARLLDLTRDKQQLERELSQERERASRGQDIDKRVEAAVESLKELGATQAKEAQGLRSQLAGEREEWRRIQAELETRLATVHAERDRLAAELSAAAARIKALEGAGAEGSQAAPAGAEGRR